MNYFVFGRDINYGDFFFESFDSKEELEDWIVSRSGEYDDIHIIEGNRMNFTIKVDWE